MRRHVVFVDVYYKNCPTGKLRFIVVWRNIDLWECAFFENKRIKTATSNDLLDKVFSPSLPISTTSGITDQEPARL